MKKVLIADDEKSFLLSLRDGLKKHGDQFSVLTAENGQKAVEILKKTPIDLLITDLKMPEMDGFELLAWVSQKKPAMPVVVMTAFGTPEIESRLGRHETLQYLEKPLDLDTLEKAILSGLDISAKSYIRGISPATFLQLMHLEKKSCSLKVRSDGQVGYIYLQQGQLIEAKTGTLEGEKAAYRIVAWEDAEIEMDSVCRRKTGTITSSFEAILLESYRIKDENELADEQQTDGPPTDHPPPEQVRKAPPFESEGLGELPTLDDLDMPEEFAILANIDEEEEPGILSQKVRELLIEMIIDHDAVDEFALYDQQSFLERKNPGCTLQDFDPAIYHHLADPLNEKLGFGACNWISFVTARRTHFLLFNLAGYSLLVKLKQEARGHIAALDLMDKINHITAT